MIQPPPPATLYAHTLRVALAAEVRAPRTEYLVEDLRTREVLADTFAQPTKPVPVGSLLKPFVAFAHVGSFPTWSATGAAAVAGDPQATGQ